jgi:pimeloyl-ACP methyl ester carboxylesterase
MQLHTITAGVLEVAYLDAGPRQGPTVVLLHGFPYDVHACSATAALLADAGCRVITPYLRGFGPTRFLRADTPRSGQQAALAFDLLTLMDALEIPSAVLAGYDWGGRAACILAALQPQRVRGLVSGNGYNIQNIAAATQPLDGFYRQGCLLVRDPAVAAGWHIVTRTSRGPLALTHDDAVAYAGADCDERSGAEFLFR